MKLPMSIVSVVSISAAVAATFAATGCKKTSQAKASIALLLPESQTARYEAADRPFFEAKFKELCPNVEVVYSNANQVAADQQQQAEAAIARGVKVMVLDPVDGDAAGVIVKNAKAKSIPVIVLTTTDDPREINHCYELGCNVYITKPIEPSAFIEIGR